MKAKSSFDIQLLDNLIKVNLNGQWTAQMDLKYLSELTEAMAIIRRNSWAVLVDMRGWQVPQEVYQSDFAFKVNLDRRNQLLECWVVDEPDQAEFIFPCFEQANIMPQRYLEMETAAQVLEEHGFTL